MVNNPSHYNSGKIETLDYIDDALTHEEYRGMLRGNILKYISRAGKKHNLLEDLKKAEFYLKRWIKHEGVEND